VGGRILGVGAQASRHKLEWSYCRSDWRMVEAAYKRQSVCKGFSISQRKGQGRTSHLAWTTKRKGAFLKELASKA
jgi:hypothetical protein